MVYEPNITEPGEPLSAAATFETELLAANHTADAAVLAFRALEDKVAFKNDNLKDLIGTEVSFETAEYYYINGGSGHGGVLVWRSTRQTANEDSPQTLHRVEGAFLGLRAIDATQVFNHRPRNKVVVCGAFKGGRPWAPEYYFVTLEHLERAVEVAPSEDFIARLGSMLTASSVALAQGPPVTSE